MLIGSILLAIVPPSLAGTAAQASENSVPALQTVPTPQQTPLSDDIVVTGLKDLNDPDSLVTRQTLGSGKVGRGAIASRTSFELATRFARCAVARNSARQALRRALDGHINGAQQAFSQARLLQTNATCASDPTAVRSISDIRAVTTTYVAGYDGTYYDRGALYVQALKTFAPDLVLRSKETNDPIIQARFNARETNRARFRLPSDMQYFQMAICLVRMQPELSVKLVMADRPRSVAPLEAAIVNRGKICVGGAAKVYFDPTQFRFYIADAVYRWAVAAKGVDSLIPLD